MNLLKELVVINEGKLKRLPPINLIYNLLFNLNASIQSGDGDDSDSGTYESLIPMNDEPGSLDANAYQIFAEYEDSEIYSISEKQSKQLAKELAKYVKDNNLESWPGEHDGDGQDNHIKTTIH